MFVLHHRLEQDSILLGKLPLCQIRLINDQQFPWLLLVPERADIVEIHQLVPTDQQQLMKESCALSQLIDDDLQPDKINIGALGNIVPQLHLHHIARYKNDSAWPGPVWGSQPAKPFEQQQLETAITEWQRRLSRLSGFSC